MSNPYQLGAEARKRGTNLSFNPFWKNQKARRYAWGQGWLEEDWKIWDKKKEVKNNAKSVKKEIFMSVEEVLKEIG